MKLVVHCRSHTCKHLWAPGGEGGRYHQVDPYQVPELVEDLFTGFLVPLRLAPEFCVGDLDVSLNLEF